MIRKLEDYSAMDLIAESGINAEDGDTRKLAGLIDRYVAKKLESLATSLNEHIDTQDRSMKAGAIDLMYTLYGNAIYPQRVQLTFDLDDYNAFAAEVGADNTKDSFVIKTDYGDVEVYRG